MGSLFFGESMFHLVPKLPRRVWPNWSKSQPGGFPLSTAKCTTLTLKVSAAREVERSRFLTC